MILLAPAVIIAAWGYSYVRSLLDALQSPGIPIELKYTTRGGEKARIYAESYTFDYKRGNLRIVKPRFEDPKGGVVAQMDFLNLTGLNAAFGADQIVRARGANLRGRLARTREGQFEIEQLLPPESDSETNIPFEVRIDGIRIDLIDRAGNGWSETMTSPGVLVAGMGKDWIAHSTGRISNVGTAEARIQYLEGFGISVLADTPRLELGRVVNHLTTTPETKAFPEARRTSVGTLSVRGPFRFFLPQGKAAQIETTAVVQATNVRYGDYFFDRGSFKGFINQIGAIGTAEANIGRNRASVIGSMRWDKTQRFAGNVHAVSSSPSELPTWARSQIPAGTSYAGADYKGWVAYYPDTGIRLSGDVAADRLVYAGETLNAPRADLRFNQGKAVVRLESGFFRGESAAGVVAYDPSRGTLLGGIDTVRVDLDKIGREFGFAGLSGEALLSATLGGTVNNPSATFNISGSGAVRYEQWRIPVTSFQASGRYADGAVSLRRALIDSPAGFITASGSLGKKGDLGLDVTVRALRPRLVDNRLGGSGNLEAKVTGTLKNPVVTGRVEGYALRYEDETLPVLTALFTATKDDVRFRQLEAIRGSGVVQGSARYAFRTRAIQADLKAQGLQVADVLGPEFVGAVEVPSLEIGGTIDKPTVTAILRGTNLLARGIKVETLSARAETVNGVIRLRDTFAQLAGGTIKVEGDYDPGKSTGTIVLNATNVDLEKLMPEFAPYVAVSGEVSGQANVTLNKGQVTAASGGGNLKNIVVNGTTVGSGPWTVGSDGKALTGTLEIGQLDRFLTLQDFRFDPRDKAVGGKLDLFNIRVEDLVAISQRYLPEGLNYEVLRALNTLNGQVSMASTISGTVDDPNIEVPTLTVTNIKFREAEFQSLNADFSLQNDVWTVRNFELLGDPTPNEGLGRRGQARYAFTGIVEEHGGSNVSGGFTNISLQELSALVPWFTGKSGDADVYFSVSGPTSSPQIRASLEAKGMLAELDKDLVADMASAMAAGPLTEEQFKTFYDKTLRVNLYDITATGGPEGKIEIEGNYFWRGFQGQITAMSPFDFPFEVPRDRPASGKITLAERELKEIAGLLDGLDAARSDGKVRGELRASGTPSNLSLDGEMVVDAKTFAIDGVEDVVQNMKGRLALEPKRIVASLVGESSRGGNVSAEVETPVSDLENFAEAVQTGVLQTLLDNPVSGSASIGKLAISHTLQGGTSVSGVVEGELALSGTLASPLIKGTGSLGSAVLGLGGFETGDSERETPVINPRFDIALNLNNPARVRNALADLYLLGNGSLKGSLEFPQIQADLHVDRGTVNLPGSRVRIEQGGTVDIAYLASPLDTMMSATVDLEGRTAVTAPRFGDILERYDVFLGIRGDLLKEGGLQLTATSDPPDLSQDRILAMLGQADLISGLGSSIGSGGLEQATERKLRNALIGFSLPMLLDPITGGIAQSLSLDYLSIEYNAYEQASLVFSKPLGNGFSIQGRRQITAPPPGFLQQYDIRLVYRPRRLPGILNRFSFSVGADELRPWKIAIEYGTRFMWK